MRKNHFIEFAIDSPSYCLDELSIPDFVQMLKALWADYPLSLSERVVIKCVHQFSRISYNQVIETIAASDIGSVQLRNAAVALGRYYQVDVMLHPRILQLPYAKAAARQLEGGRLYSTSYIPNSGDFALYFDHPQLFKHVTQRYYREGAKPVIASEPRSFRI
jgi:hypothetical protein